MTGDPIHELATLITRVRGGWTGPVVEETVLGTGDPSAIARLLAEWTATHVGSAPARVEWYHASSGVVVGWTLLDGRRVVVKAHAPGVGEEHLRAVASVRTRLVRAGVPCADTITGPRPCGGSVATAETMIDDPGPTVERDRAANVAGLAQCVRGAGASIDPGLVNAIDAAVAVDRLGDHGALAAAAVAAMAADDSPLCIGHLDWSARNVRWDRGGLLAVFDLDSLGAAPESVIVGRASMLWCTTLELDDRPLPAPDEVRAYVDDYVSTVRTAFAATQLRAVWGAASAALCDAVDNERRWGVAGPAHVALDRDGAEWLRRCRGEVT